MSHDDPVIRRRLEKLRAFAAGAPMLPILVQRDPDPDGMASALGVRVLLDRLPEGSPIISLGEVQRPENRRLAELLDIRVTRVTASELAGFRRVVAVDTQPDMGASETRFAVIDHHPPRVGHAAEFSDIRPDIGAASTMVTQYLRAAGPDRITPRLATALLYGIRTDTDLLRRGSVADDVEAFAHLQGLADAELLHKIGRPSFGGGAVRTMGRALAGLARRGDVAVAFLGRIEEEDAHVLPTLADFCLAVEAVAWSAAGAVVGDQLVVNIRKAGTGSGAGELAASLAGPDGQGGGHPSMGRVAMPVPGEIGAVQAGDQDATRVLLDRVAGGVEALRALR